MELCYDHAQRNFIVLHHGVACDELTDDLISHAHYMGYAVPAAYSEASAVLISFAEFLKP